MSHHRASLSRYYSTVRHLKWQQVSNRILRRLFPPAARPVTGGRLVEFEGWKSPVPKLRHLDDEGRLSIFGLSRETSSRELWSDSSVPRLWLYHAHYCDDVASDDVPDELKRRHIANWMSANGSVSSPGWEPYPLSRRVVNWLKYYLAGGQLRACEVDSLASQADLLSRSLEFHLLGNHLLANLKALIFAGVLVDVPASGDWVRQGEDLLRQQLAEQILPDGGHHERSPMYHAVVLEDLLDLINLCETVHPVLAGDLKPVCTSMLDWLAAMTQPDGQIALFNDAAFDGCSVTGDIVGYARRVGLDGGAVVDGLVDLPQTGYTRMSSGPLTVIADLAPIGPVHLPGHAHADSLSFELSVGTQRVLVHTGTSTYDDVPERHRQRSTAAHNTIVVDQQNSSDIWSVFRVGRRAQIFDRFVDVTCSPLQACASHDGYVKGLGVVHRRCFELYPDMLRIRDILTGPGTHFVELPLHLHPLFVPKMVKEGHVRLSSVESDVELEVVVDASLNARLTASTYHPEFGHTVPNTSVLSSATLELPCDLETTIRLAS